MSEPFATGGGGSQRQHDGRELSEEPEDRGVEVPLVPRPGVAPAQLELPAVPVTGDPRVDDALARLAELEDLPVEEHLPVYRDVHRRLHETLADLDVG